MINLPDVTLIIADTRNYGQALSAIHKSLKHIKPAAVKFFTNADLPVMPGIEVIRIDTMYSKKDYSYWMMRELGKYQFDTSHLLVIQHDGYVLDGEQWTDEFLKYSYIGAPWMESDGYNVGNGGFSLRSVRLHEILATDSLIKGLQPEDSAICRIYRDYLELNYDIKFAPDQLAERFAFELCEPKDKTFGFHGYFHKPYVEPIVIKRSGAMGDIIQIEPVLEYFHKLGHPVYLDCPVGVYQLFARHYYPIRHVSQLDPIIKHREINLDMAYEMFPRELHLKAYFETVGIKDYELRNPCLKYPMTESMKLFSNYIVLHVDARNEDYRNINGVDWHWVVSYLADMGFTVIQIGKGESEDYALRFNAVNEVMLSWLIAGCNLMISIDSGPSHIAVALDIPSVIFFGSVDPHKIHYDLSNITVIQNKCPLSLDGCWHSSPSTSGSECSVEDERDSPPCCTFTTQQVINELDKIIKL